MMEQSEAAEAVRTTTILDYIVRTDTISAEESPSAEMLLEWWSNVSEL